MFGTELVQIILKSKHAAWAFVRAYAILTEVALPTRTPKSAPHSGGKRRLLFDVTQTASLKILTGIQRSIRRLSAELVLREASLPFEPVLVRLKRDGRSFALFEAGDFTGEVAGKARPETEIAIQPGDILVMLDSTWLEFGRFVKTVLPVIRANGGRLVTGLYDLIPIDHPEYFAGFVTFVFERWIKMALAESDAMVCISAATKDTLDAYRARIGSKHPLKVEYFHLGADLAGSIKPNSQTEPPTILMVGTIEPRKGYDTALAAFKLLWREGIDVRLRIIGKSGWDAQSLIDEMQNSNNDNLFVSFGANDTVLREAYSQCHAVLSASRVEGFGLPVAEAAQLGKPLIVSDIPVYREITKGAALFFDPESPADLARVVKIWLADPSNPKPARPATWSDSVGQLTHIIETLVWNDVRHVS